MIKLLKENKKIIAVMLSCFFALFAVFCVFAYIAGPAKAVFQSDCSDTLYWANASRDSGSLINPDFNYAAILPFGGTAIMWLLIPFFGCGITSHTIGMIIFAALMFAAVFALFKVAGYSLPVSFLSVGSVALALTAGAKMREIFFEHVIYYSLSGVLMCILLILYFNIKKLNSENKIKVIAFAVITAVFSLLSGLDGFQIVATAAFPVLFAVGAEVFFSKDKLFSKANINKAVFCVLVFAFSVLGVILIKFVFKGEASYADGYSTYSKTEEWGANASKFFLQWFSLFGIENTERQGMFSLLSAFTGVRIAVSVLIFTLPLISLFFIKKLGENTRTVVLSNLGLVLVIAYGYIFGSLSTAAWRLCPLVFSGIITVLFVLADVFNKEPLNLKRTAALCFAALFAFCCVNFAALAPEYSKGITDNRLYGITKVLKSRQLDFGYATFWNSQTVSVLSDGKIRCANIDIGKQSGVSTWYYQSDRNWYKDGASKSGEYFLLLTTEEYENLQMSDEWEEIFGHRLDIFSFENFIVLVTDSNFYVY